MYVLRENYEIKFNCAHFLYTEVKPQNMYFYVRIKIPVQCLQIYLDSNQPYCFQIQKITLNTHM